MRSADCSLHAPPRGLVKALSLSWLTAILGGGCIAPTPSLPPAPARQPHRSAIIFLVDGCDRERLLAELAAGNLPNIQSHFVQSGISVERAIGCIPALTYPNTASLMTGRFPGHHGIVGNQWFDRSSMYIRDYIRPLHYRDVNQHFDAPTIHELLHDCLTINIQCHTRRGVSHTIDNDLTTALAFSVGPVTQIDSFVGTRMSEVSTLVRRDGRWPTLLVAYFPGMDETGHQSGPESPAYARALRNVDRAMGRILSHVHAAGRSSTTYTVLCSDHGHVSIPPDNAWSVARWLRKRGRHVHTGALDDTRATWRTRRLDRFDTVLTSDRYRSCAIYVRGAAGWSQAADQAEIEQSLGPLTDLTAIPAVEMVLSRMDGGHAQILSRYGRARIERRQHESAIQYRLTDVIDFPLRQGDSPAYSSFIRSGWHTSREWLNNSAESHYPDVVPQAYELMHSSNAPDVVLFAAADWAFGESSRSEHGSCLSRDRLVPMYFAGPGMPGGATVPVARLVDVMPTIMDLLGYAERVHALPLDGMSLRDQLLPSEPREPTDTRSLNIRHDP